MSDKYWFYNCPNCKEKHAITIPGDTFIDGICLYCGIGIFKDGSSQKLSQKDLLVLIGRIKEHLEQATFCAYCGHEYPKGTPNFQNDALSEHIKVCEKHPMRELEKKHADVIKAVKTFLNDGMDEPVKNDLWNLMIDLGYNPDELTEIPDDD